MNPLAYIAGPYSADDAEQVELNVAKAMDVGDRLEDSGLCYVLIPHLAHFRDLRHPRSYEFRMSACFRQLQGCDALLRMPGPSKGADREVVQAKAWNIPVFHDEAELLAWADRWSWVRR